MLFSIGNRKQSHHAISANVLKTLIHVNMRKHTLGGNFVSDSMCQYFLLQLHFIFPLLYIWAFQRQIPSLLYNAITKCTRQRTVWFTKQSTWGGPLELIQSACFNVIYTCQSAQWWSQLGMDIWDLLVPHIYHSITIKVMSSCLLFIAVIIIYIYIYIYIYNIVYLQDHVYPISSERSVGTVFSLHVIMWKCFPH